MNAVRNKSPSPRCTTQLTTDGEPLRPASTASSIANWRVTVPPGPPVTLVFAAVYAVTNTTVGDAVAAAGIVLGQVRGGRVVESRYEGKRAA
jgi:hypothetical protein